MLFKVLSTAYASVGTVVKCSLAATVLALMWLEVPGPLAHAAAGWLALADLVMLHCVLWTKQHGEHADKTCDNARARVHLLGRWVKHAGHCLEGGVTTWLALNYAFGFGFAPTHGLHVSALLLGLALVALQLSLSNLKKTPALAV